MNRILLVTGVTARLGHSLSFVAQTSLAIDLFQLVQAFEQRVSRPRRGHSKKGRNHSMSPQQGEVVNIPQNPRHISQRHGRVAAKGRGLSSYNNKL
jgi:hypothetical protein